MASLCSMHIFSQLFLPLLYFLPLSVTYAFFTTHDIYFSSLLFIDDLWCYSLSLQTEESFLFIYFLTTEMSHWPKQSQTYKKHSASVIKYPTSTLYALTEMAAVSLLTLSQPFPSSPAKASGSYAQRKPSTEAYLLNAFFLFANVLCKSLFSSSSQGLGTKIPKEGLSSYIMCIERHPRCNGCPLTRDQYMRKIVLGLGCKQEDILWWLEWEKKCFER